MLRFSLIHREVFDEADFTMCYNPEVQVNLPCTNLFNPQVIKVDFCIIMASFIYADSTECHIYIHKCTFMLMLAYHSFLPIMQS
jgi:hypothetical protein